MTSDHRAVSTRTTGSYAEKQTTPDAGSEENKYVKFQRTSKMYKARVLKDIKDFRNFQNFQFFHFFQYFHYFHYLHYFQDFQDDNTVYSI